LKRKREEIMHRGRGEGREKERKTKNHYRCIKVALPPCAAIKGRWSR